MSNLIPFEQLRRASWERLPYLENCPRLLCAQSFNAKIIDFYSFSNLYVNKIYIAMCQDSQQTYYTQCVSFLYLLTVLRTIPGNTL